MISIHLCSFYGKICHSGKCLGVYKLFVYFVDSTQQLKMRNNFILSIFFLFIHLGYAYSQSPARLMRTYEKGDFIKTRELIIKSLEKDTINPAARYLYSILFMEDPFRLNTDSARSFINEAIADYEISGEDIKEDLSKAEITLDSLQNHKLKVTNQAFGTAKAEETVEAIDYFLKHYPEAPQLSRGIFIRDSLAYDITKNQDTWDSYKKYMETYPDSYYYSEADTHYQRLIFIEKTLDNKLNSFVKFLKAFPATPHRAEIEWVILSRTTVNHNWKAYHSFLSNYPDSYLDKKVIDMLYYIDKSNGYSRYNELLSLAENQDSLNLTKTIEYPLLFPIFIDGKYGFITTKGETILDPQFNHILASYYCGGIDSEWLLVTESGQQKIINRQGSTLIEGPDNYQLLGNGIALVQRGKGKYLYHMSGFRLNEQNYEEAEVIGGHLIKVKQGNSWGLVSMLGLSILEEKYETIEKRGKFVVIGDGQKYFGTNLSVIADQMKNGEVNLDFSFEDYEVLGDSLLLTFNGDKEALYDENLEEIIPKGDHRIFINGSTWYIKKEDGFQIYSRSNDQLINQTFPFLDVNNGWMAIKRDQDWLLISQRYKVLPKQGLDSIRLINDEAAFIKKGDTLQIIFNNGKVVWMQDDEKMILLSSRERSGNEGASYIMLFEDDYRKILSAQGELLISGKYEQIDFLTDSLLTFKKGEDFGIMDVHGKVILRAFYQNISVYDGLVSLLDDGKIGCYNPKTGRRIPTDYDSRLTAFDEYFVILKDDKMGIINVDNEVVIPIEYDEFMHWNDTSFLARDSSSWQIMTYGNEVLATGLMKPELIAENGEEQFMKVLRDQGFGVFSNQNGQVLETAYNDIVNVGSYDNPAFFAEQHLKAASFFVVTYFNGKGETLKSQAYRPEEYNKIYCDQ